MSFIKSAFSIDPIPFNILQDQLVFISLFRQLIIHSTYEIRDDSEIIIEGEFILFDDEG